MNEEEKVCCNAKCDNENCSHFGEHFKTEECDHKCPHKGPENGCV